MVEFAYNNAKNTSTGYTFFELNCGFYSRIFYEEDVDLCSKLKTEHHLAIKLQTLISVCRKNLHHFQKL